MSDYKATFSTFSLFCCLLLGLVGCRGGATTTPTPFPTVGTGTAVSAAQTPVVATLAELAAGPEQFDGATLQLTGRYQRAPLLICSSDPHPSPAAWTLAEGSAVIQAGGFDSQLRALLPDDLTITVEGRWQLWQGPVGCGKQAIPSTVWYLSVSRILSPALLTQVTLTPSPIGQVAGSPAATGQPLPTTNFSTLPPIQETPGEVVTTLPPQQPTAETETTPQPTLTGVPPTLETPTLSETATAISEATAEITPTQDITAVAPTATSAGTAVSTPNTSGTPAGSTVINKGGFTTEVLATEQIGQNEIHTWNYTITASSLITLYLASPPNGDMAIAITDPAGNLLVQQNNAPAGQIETLAAYELPTAGVYQIQIWAANGIATTYSMSVTDDVSYPLPFVGVLNYGETRLIDLPERTDQFVHFYGTLGEIVTITAEPLDNGDLFLYLHGIDASILEEFFDETGPGEVEQLAGFVLPATGLYAIRIGEYDFNATQYEITITR